MPNPRLPETAEDVFVRRTRLALERQRQNCAHPEQVTARVLADLLGQVQGTVFARDHGLPASVKSVADWRRAIPIRDYEGFRPYIDQQLHNRPAVLTQDAPYAFLRTSGTSGRPKLIPTTDHWRSRYRGPALYAQWGLYVEHLALRRLPPDAVVDLSWAPAAPRERTAGFPVYNITQRPGTRSTDDWTPPWLGTPWFGDGTQDADGPDDVYALIRWLAGRGVRLIVSVNPSKITMLAECLEAHTGRLLRDLWDGTLRSRPHPGLTGNRRLARRLEAARGRKGRLDLTDLWPRMSLRVCWNSASASLYQPWLDRVAPGTSQLPFSCTGTEGIVTIPTDGHPSAGPLAVDQGIFEFVPWETLEDGSPLPPDAETVEPLRTETGGTYRLVMSQGNGLYRYDVGDVYEVVGRVGRVPRLEFLGRAGFQSSFTGEKLTDADLYQAVCRALRVGATDCPLFTCVPVWGEPPVYRVVMEHQESDTCQVGELADRLDGALRDINVEYAEKRGTGRIAPVEVRPVPPGTFTRVADLRVRAGASPAQLKHQWLQRDASLLELIEELAPAHRGPAGSFGVYEQVGGPR